jgi:hypothetical protein
VPTTASTSTTVPPTTTSGRYWIAVGGQIDTGGDVARVTVVTRLQTDSPAGTSGDVITVSDGGACSPASQSGAADGQGLMTVTFACPKTRPWLTVNVGSMGTSAAFLFRWAGA